MQSNYTMTASTDLQHHIATLIGDETITKVVETGTYLGNGTTKAVLKGMRNHGMEYEFYSIECNPAHYKEAVKNNAGQKVNFVLGKSCPKSMEPVSFSFNEVPENVFIDFTPHTRERLYRSEMNFNVPDDRLGFILKDFTPELIILDSAGHMGLTEFKYTVELMKFHSYYLILDDIQHIKHYHSMLLVKEQPEIFEILWESDEDELHRSAIIKVNGM